MARINVESNLYQDPRFFELIQKLGSIESALGALVRAWTIGQSFYLKGDRRIPFSDWTKHKLKDEIILVGLAESNGISIRLAGADEQFSWLLQRSEAGKKNKGQKRTTVNDRSIPFNSDKPLTLTLPLPLKEEEYIYTENSKTEEPPKENNSDVSHREPSLGEDSKREQVNLCLEQWKDTLKHYGINILNTPLNGDVLIARSIKANGYENTRLALLGAKFEAKTENFDPASCVNIKRVFKQDLFDKFVNLGLRHLNQSREEANRLAERTANISTPSPVADQESVYRLIQKIRG